MKNFFELYYVERIARCIISVLYTPFRIYKWIESEVNPDNYQYQIKMQNRINKLKNKI